MIIESRWKLFLLLWLGICLAMSTHAQETDFALEFEVQSDETGVIFRDGFEQLVIEDWGRDIISTALDVNVMAQSATATIVVRASASLGASFEIGDLEITDVRNESGPLMF